MVYRLVGLFVVVVTLGFLLTLLAPLNACLDPASLHAVEVVFNKPEVSYNLTVLEELAASGKVLKVDNSTYVFAVLALFTHTTRLLVVVYVERFSEGAPHVEGLSNPSEAEYYLGVRLELPATEYVSEEHLGTVVEELIEYLVEIGVLNGLAPDDVVSIARTARLGFAGWNNRLVYSKVLGRWAPYSELVNAELMKGVLIRGNACSAQVPREVLGRFYEIEPFFVFTVLTGTTPIEPTSTSYAIPVHQIVNNGLTVAISIIVGVIAGLVVYLYLTRKD